jgi:hypothetical protein
MSWNLNTFFRTVAKYMRYILLSYNCWLQIHKILSSVLWMLSKAQKWWVFLFSFFSLSMPHTAAWRVWDSCSAICHSQPWFPLPRCGLSGGGGRLCSDSLHTNHEALCREASRWWASIMYDIFDLSMHLVTFGQAVSEDIYSKPR